MYSCNWDANNSKINCLAACAFLLCGWAQPLQHTHLSRCFEPKQLTFGKQFRWILFLKNILTCEQEEPGVKPPNLTNNGRPAPTELQPPSSSTPTRRKIKDIFHTSDPASAGNVVSVLHQTFNKSHPNHSQSINMFKDPVLQFILM